MLSKIEEIREITWSIASRLTRQENTMMLLFWLNARDQKGGCDLSEYVFDLCYDEDLWQVAKRGMTFGKWTFPFHV